MDTCVVVSTIDACVGVLHATFVYSTFVGPRFFLRIFFPFFGGIFFWSCCGRLPSGSCLQNDSCFSVRDPRSDIGLLQNERFVLTTSGTLQAGDSFASWPFVQVHRAFFPSFLSCCLLSFPSLPPFLPSFLPSFLSSFLHHISKARIANSHKSKKQQKPTEAFESQHKSPKANRSQQKPTEASNSYQKPLKATSSQQKPPEATKIPQKPTKATKSE